MKILIPTDFSKLSKVAIQYALDFSKDIDMQLMLLHVVNNKAPTIARVSSKKLDEIIKINSERKMKELVKTLKQENNHNPKISSKIIFGYSIEKEIEAFSLKNNIDMICIGTKGATGLKKVLIGSNAASIINHSRTPVLTIPEYARYRGIKNIVYSSDLSNIDEELESIIPFAKLLNSWVHILHIEGKNEDFDKDALPQERRLKKLFSYKKIKIKQLQSESIVNGINQYIADIDADMLTMFTHRTNLFEKIFQKSVTQKAAFQTRIPLFTFHKSNEFFNY